MILGGGPNRIGQGIEFDYCCVHAAAELPRAGLRGGDRQLQPRDRLDRLRHLRPALLRAARRGGGARGARARAAGRRLHPVRRPDAAEARRARSSAPATGSSARRCDAIDLAEDRERFGLLAELDRRALPGVGDRRERRTRRSRSPSEIGYPVLVRPSYVLGGARDARLLRRRRRERGDGGGRGRRARRPLPRGRGRARRRRALRRQRDLRRRGDGARRGGRASTRATRPACCPRPPTTARAARDRPPPRPGARRRRAAQRPARAPRRRALRARGEPARLAHGAVRVQGDRRQPRRRRLPARRRRDARRARRCPPRASAMPGLHVKAAVLPVRALPRRRSGARPGDALDRRGDGERAPTSRPRSRRPSGPPGRALPAGGRAFVSVRDADKAAVVPIARAPRRARLRARRDRRHRARARARRDRRQRGRQGRRRRRAGRAAARSTCRQHARRAATPAATATRSARRRCIARVPCITTLAGARAARRGDRERRGDEPALSLQERQAGQPSRTEAADRAAS